MKKVKLIRPTINCSYNVKNSFYQIFTTCYAQNSPKIKSPQNLLKFGNLIFQVRRSLL